LRPVAATLREGDAVQKSLALLLGSFFVAPARETANIHRRNGFQVTDRRAVPRPRCGCILVRGLARRGRDDLHLGTIGKPDAGARGLVLDGANRQREVHGDRHRPRGHANHHVPRRRCWLQFGHAEDGEKLREVLARRRVGVEARLRDAPVGDGNGHLPGEVLRANEVVAAREDVRFLAAPIETVLDAAQDRIADVVLRGKRSGSDGGKSHSEALAVRVTLRVKSS
jgi:uncharacterized protein YqgV (UPF0045/DUF77 family)